MGPSALRRLLALTSLLLCASSLSAQVFVVGEKTAEADVTTDFRPTHVDLPHELLSQPGYLDLIRNLESEQGFAHRELPLGAGLTLIANGNLSPRDEAYKKMLYQKGQAAAPGDRVAITALEFKPDRIVIDLNGGPYAKHRFLSHIQLNDMQIAQQGPVATGSRITLVFEGGVPDLTAAEVKALLDPIIDFKARSSAEAYTNTLTPKVRDAVESHEILVGMTRRMVLAAVGSPKSKHREHLAAEDSDSPVYEEWLYGDPPQPTQFVRFSNGRVIRLEIAALGKPVEVHDKNEVGPDQSDPALIPRTIANGDAQPIIGGDKAPAPPPSLRRPGEVLDTSATTMGKVNIPADTPAPNTPAPASPPRQFISSSNTGS